MQVESSRRPEGDPGAVLDIEPLLRRRGARGPRAAVSDDGRVEVSFEVDARCAAAALERGVALLGDVLAAVSMECELRRVRAAPSGERLLT